MNKTGNDDATPNKETDDLSTDELQKVAGGGTSTLQTGWYCNSSGVPTPGSGTDAPGWRYDPATQGCMHLDTM